METEQANYEEPLSHEEQCALYGAYTDSQGEHSECTSYSYGSEDNLETSDAY